MTPGAPIAAEYKKENLRLLEAGLPNLQRHITSAGKFGVPCVSFYLHAALWRMPFSSSVAAAITIVLCVVSSQRHCCSEQVCH